jgi:hypothetical protein
MSLFLLLRELSITMIRVSKGDSMIKDFFLGTEHSGLIYFTPEAIPTRKVI